ncbi:hypothetical protein CNMCM6936_005010 [Aspergillus lentulus]|nr:hypothetical protein CNMCM6069_009418 [Aspergillus lentulus]KAF4158276.1 hypothetical protein CNMCM6936_005010 [Aspergillus lentulus]KAF4170943.1 hypothetical protein CNMCM8060_004034 [Aspergillus lentulus]
MVESFNDIEAWALREILYDKAIHSPSEITQEEKHAILEWPSLEQMEETSQKYVGKSLQDLIHTAVNDPLALTYAECRLIDEDFQIFKALDACKYKNDRRKLMIEDQDFWNKWQQARAAVLSPDELKALENVREVFLGKARAYSNPAAERYWTHPPDWVQGILDREGTKEAWRACWDHLIERLRDFPLMVIGSQKIQDSKILDFVDYGAEMGGVDQLRRDFRDRRDQGGLKPGVLSNVFINVPTECRDAYLQREDGCAWVWAIDPDWSLPGPDADGYDGRVEVTWNQLFNKFYDVMSTEKVTLKAIWEEFHEVNETLPEPVPGWAFPKVPKRVWPDN